MSIDLKMGFEWRGISKMARRTLTLSAFGPFSPLIERFAGFGRACALAFARGKMLRQISRSLATNRQGSALGLVATLAALAIIGVASRTFASDFVRAGFPESGYVVRFVLPPASTASTSLSSASPLALPRRFQVVRPGNILTGNGDLPGLAATKAVNPAASGRSAGLLPIRFDLSTGSGGTAQHASETIVKKVVRVHSRSVGSIDVAVADVATLFVERSEIMRLLADDPAIEGALASARGQRLSLADLRDLGLTVRYDPLADAIDIDPNT